MPTLPSRALPERNQRGLFELPRLSTRRARAGCGRDAGGPGQRPPAAHWHGVRESASLRPEWGSLARRPRRARTVTAATATLELLLLASCHGPAPVARLHPGDRT
jgi:hypothetical protein